MKMTKQLLILKVVLIGLALTIILPAATAIGETKKDVPITIPETNEEAMGLLYKLALPLPNAIKESWAKALAYWNSLWEKGGEMGWTQFIANKAKEGWNFLEEQYYYRKGFFNEELQKEWTELKTEFFKLIKR